MSADQAERARQRLEELRLAEQQGQLDEARAKRLWDEYVRREYELPRQRRLDALAEQREQRLAASEGRAAPPRSSRSARRPASKP